MFACCVRGNHVLRKSGTHADAACLCLPMDVPDRSCMMVAYPGIHQVSDDSLLCRQYYRSTNLLKKRYNTKFDSNMSKKRYSPTADQRGTMNTSPTISNFRLQQISGFKNARPVAYMFSLMCSSVVGGFMTRGQGGVVHY